MPEPIMEFFAGRMSSTGVTLLGDDGSSYAIRSWSDDPLKLDKEVSVILYGTLAGKRSTSKRRVLVKEVYVQQSLL